MVSGGGVGAAFFFGTSSAANSTFTINGGALRGAGNAFMQFAGTSTADNAALIYVEPEAEAVFGE